MASGTIRYKRTELVNWHLPTIVNSATATSIADLYSNSREGITNYYADNTDLLSDWGTKTKTYYCDIRIVRYGGVATIDVSGCAESGAPLRWTCQKVGTQYIWRKVTLETP